ncbi:MAG: hypothetical protein IKP64_14220 [Selenomonadaceae bacterium]|nr:hypothetical protein [Selenomonadaceae bacterium]MBR4384698.1 hypothetical protein [Selenomonadaceae bacterium]
MNGSENGYAGALFFALISLGAVLKVDDVIGLFVGAASALFAAVSLRRALVKSAQAAEEDHQRIEIQLQQLRRKFSETSSINVAAMSTVNDVAQIMQENLQAISVRLSELDNVPDLTRNIEGIRSALANLEEHSAALNIMFEKILSVATTPQEKSSEDTDLVATSFTALTTEVKQLNEISAANKQALQTVLKLLQLVGQSLKNPSYSKNLDNINSSVETLAARGSDFVALKNSMDDAQKNLSELVRISSNISKNFSSTLDDLRLDVAKLSAKLESLNSSTDNHAALTSQDINLLKKIAAKINLK